MHVRLSIRVPASSPPPIILSLMPIVPRKLVLDKHADWARWDDALPDICSHSVQSSIYAQARF
jgi:hypothetical protein